MLSPSWQVRIPIRSEWLGVARMASGSSHALAMALAHLFAGVRAT